MADEAIRTLVAQGLSALKARSRVAEKATAEIQNDARDAGLKKALDEGNSTSKKWAERIDRAINEAGAVEQADNKILEAHFKVAKKIQAEAKDDQSRDLGIIAAGQLALHYWIAAFGTRQTHASKLGMSQTEQNMQASLDEATQAAEQHTALSQKIMSQSA